MKVLSSPLTWFYKKGLPAAFVAGLVVLAVGNILSGQYRHEPGVLLIPPLMIVLILAISNRMNSKLADRVELHAGFLRVTLGARVVDIRLADVFGVSLNRASAPRRVVLQVANSRLLGDELLFIPAGWNPLRPASVVALRQGMAAAGSGEAGE
jgi:hypothetical protein